MSTKFKIPARSTSQPEVTLAPPPTTHEEFAAGASLVQSQAGNRPVKPVRLNLDLDPATHKRLKMKALQTSQTMAELVRALIDRELG
jgi:hypothetical protein